MVTGAAAAVGSALAGLFALILYLYRRHDSPGAAGARLDESAARDMEAVDEALGEMDADSLTRSYAELYGRVDGGLLRQDSAYNSGRPDNGQP